MASAVLLPVTDFDHTTKSIANRDELRKMQLANMDKHNRAVKSVKTPMSFIKGIPQPRGY